MEVEYLKLLNHIKSKGTYKPAAREGMPGTKSIFGFQMRHDLSEGFPLLTTKKINWSHIVHELLWFMKGDTNIKYLVDKGCNIWNEDAYNYYLKKLKQYYPENKPYKFDEFIQIVKSDGLSSRFGDYQFGDCGKQYGWLWRNWDGNLELGKWGYPEEGLIWRQKKVDQLKDLIKGIRKNPMGRRHIITAWNPATLDDMALNACHAFVQFNCRPLTLMEQELWAQKNGVPIDLGNEDVRYAVALDEIPMYKLDCQMYQRSADVVLGVPYNIASYALLTHIIAKMCNMIAGDFIHSFGDVHIYDNHMDAVNEQLVRTPDKLPELVIKGCPNLEWNGADIDAVLKSIEGFELETFKIEGYNPQASIKAKLSTGLK